MEAGLVPTIGAHPSFANLETFGRRRAPMQSPDSARLAPALLSATHGPSASVAKAPASIRLEGPDAGLACRANEGVHGRGRMPER
jgi:hypothetical protein